MITAKGNAPMKISDSFMLGSFSVDLMTKHDIPSGGCQQSDLGTDHRDDPEPDQIQIQCLDGGQ